MDPVLVEVYTNIGSAPFLIAAYALMWVVLLVFVGVMLARVKRTQADIDALKDALDRREEGGAREGGADGAL